MFFLGPSDSWYLITAPGEMPSKREIKDNKALLVPNGPGNMGCGLVTVTEKHWKNRAKVRLNVSRAHSRVPVFVFYCYLPWFSLQSTMCMMLTNYIMTVCPAPQVFVAWYWKTFGRKVAPSDQYLWTVLKSCLDYCTKTVSTSGGVEGLRVERQKEGRLLDLLT